MVTGKAYMFQKWFVWVDDGPRQQVTQAFYHRCEVGEPLPVDDQS